MSGRASLLWLALCGCGRDAAPPVDTEPVSPIDTGTTPNDTDTTVDTTTPPTSTGGTPHTGDTGTSDDTGTPEETGTPAETGSVTDTCDTGSSPCGGCLPGSSTPRIQGDVDLWVDSHATLYVPHAGALGGKQATSAGDVNGDGIGDVIIDAKGVSGPNYWENGAAYLVHGPILPGSHDLAAVGVQINPLSNLYVSSWIYSVAGVGDIDGDGLDDIAVQDAKWNDLNNLEPAGMVALFSGPVGVAGDKLSLADASIHLAGEAGDTYGGDWWSDHSKPISPAIDLNGDGQHDLMVGAPGGRGAVLIHYGPLVAGAYSAPLTADVELVGTPVDWEFGHAPRGVGDVNGDGVTDIVVDGRNAELGSGLPLTLTYEGAFYLFHGPPVDGTPSDLADAARWGNAGDYLSEHGAAGGDFNNDGYSDVVVSTDKGSSAVTNDNVYVYFGPLSGISAADITADITIASATVDTRGHKPRGPGDISGDGCDDLLIMGIDPLGWYYVYGPIAAGVHDVGVLADGQLTVVDEGDAGNAGDVDGDGQPDLIIGDRDTFGGGVSGGGAFIVLGGSL